MIQDNHDRYVVSVIRTKTTKRKKKSTIEDLQHVRMTLERYRTGALKRDVYGVEAMPAWLKRISNKYPSVTAGRSGFRTDFRTSLHRYGFFLARNAWYQLCSRTVRRCYLAANASSSAPSCISPRIRSYTFL